MRNDDGVIVGLVGALSVLSGGGVIYISTRGLNSSATPESFAFGERAAAGGVVLLILGVALLSIAGFLGRLRERKQHHPV